VIHACHRSPSSRIGASGHAGAVQVEGDVAFSERFGIHVERGWRVFEEVSRSLAAAAERHEADRWGLHLFFDDDGALVGCGGWKGAPVDGVVELGYAVAPARRRRGVATSAVRDLLSRAQDTGLRVVTAHTLAQDSASTAVLRRCGFKHVAEFVHPDDGIVWRWECLVGEER
jgi:ribosomal-protein-alanine N-acetyltransferase